MNVKRLIEKQQTILTAFDKNPHYFSKLSEECLIESLFSFHCLGLAQCTRKDILHCITEGGISAKRHIFDYLELYNIKKAYQRIEEWVNEGKTITLADVIGLNRTLCHHIADDKAGLFKRMATPLSDQLKPLPTLQPTEKVMQDLPGWLSINVHPIKCAADITFRFIAIQPFLAYNALTGWLLGAALLMKAGFPAPYLLKKEKDFLLQNAHDVFQGDGLKTYYSFYNTCINRSLTFILKTLDKTDTQQPEFIKIGILAKKSNETIPTIRHWTKQGLLNVSDYTEGGYQLYSPDTIEKAKSIRKWQTENRLTLQEIKSKIRA